MPVVMRQIKSGKSKGKWYVAERDTGARVYPKSGGTTKAKARSVLQARNLAHARSRGYKVPRQKRKSRKR